MAQSLSSAIGQNGDNSVTQAVFLDYLSRHEDADAAIEDAKETVRSLNRVKKNLRKTISAEGINIEVFDRALEDGKKSGETRDAEDRQYRRYMAFQHKPIGLQVGMDFTSPDPGLMALNKLELGRIDAQGYQAGNGGHPRESNTFSLGTEAYQAWDSAWVRGNADFESDGLGEQPAAPKRGRGRPRKNGAAGEHPNMTEYLEQVGGADGTAATATPKRGRGRPRKAPEPEDAGAEA